MPRLPDADQSREHDGFGFTRSRRGRGMPSKAPAMTPGNNENSDDVLVSINAQKAACWLLSLPSP